MLFVPLCWLPQSQQTGLSGTRARRHLRIADNMVLYQRSSGGWPKNIDMGKAAQRLLIKLPSLRQKNETDSTIDNGATYTQLSFLARVYTAQHQERHRESFLKGLDYLLKAQYANGGWPQFYPNLTRISQAHHVQRRRDDRCDEVAA